MDRDSSLLNTVSTASAAKSRLSCKGQHLPKMSTTFLAYSILTKSDGPSVEHSPQRGRHRAETLPHKTPADCSSPQTSFVRKIERQSPCLPSRRQILFFHEDRPYYGFTNFSADPVEYEGKIYSTSEHLYQSFKVCLPASYYSTMRNSHPR